MGSHEVKPQGKNLSDGITDENWFVIRSGSKGRFAQILLGNRIRRILNTMTLDKKKHIKHDTWIVKVGLGPGEWDTIIRSEYDKGILLEACLTKLF